MTRQDSNVCNICGATLVHSKPNQDLRTGKIIGCALCFNWEVGCWAARCHCEGKPFDTSRVFGYFSEALNHYQFIMDFEIDEVRPGVKTCRELYGEKIQTYDVIASGKGVK